MTSKQVLIIIFSLCISSCENDSYNNTSEPDILLDERIGYGEMIRGINENLLAQAVEQPDANGALSRNKDGYFSVRFQINISRLSDLAIATNRLDALTQYLNALKYSFSYINPDGSYQLTPPEELINDPTINLPNKGDSVSAVAFFGYALGISLHALDESAWYSNDAAASSVKNEIESFSLHIQQTLNYLIANQSILKQVDGLAPNRLLFDAIAYYGLGKYLGDLEAQSIGIQFLNLALNFIDQEEGYFIEGGGWDSSYNGVSIKLCMELYAILPADHPMKDSLADAIIGATIWQKSRILANGEISTEGNTRVYPGGESFLGNEKAVDVEKTVLAFFYFSELTGENEYKKLAEKILNFYQ